MIPDNTNAQTTNGDPFVPLYQHKFALLTTFRKDGRGVPTPVWFAHEQGKLYIMTPTTTGKVKRIRNNGRVTLAPSDTRGHVLGDTVEGHARILPPDAAALARNALARKYGLFHRIFTLFLRIRKTKRVYIEIAP